jgi:predicted Holliday junction resolvase-like endonuclease
MTNNNIIAIVRKSGLVASCSHCGTDFDLSKATIFDGLSRFPDSAQLRKEEMVRLLKERTLELQKRKISVIDAEKKAIEVGVGKIIEKILPAYRDFKLALCDCRALFEPVDIIAFNGASSNRVESIKFIEIKTGKSRLNNHQKAIRDAIENMKIRYEEV